MRLLYVADPFLPVPPPLYGGIERVVASLLRLAVAAGHEITLLAHPDSFIPGVNVLPLEGGIAPSPREVCRNALRVRQAIKDFRPDLIHCFARLGYLLPVLGSSIAKIVSYQREPAARSVRWASYLAGGSLGFVACSEFIRQRGAPHGGNWDAIPNGVDLEHYTFRPQVPADAPLIFLGRIERIKGPHRAIAIARAAGHPLILAGNHAVTGPEADFWAREIKPTLGQDGISYIGPVDDRQKNVLLGGAAALLVPIEWEEPFGLVFAEALACGTPIISCPRGALPEIVNEGRTGFLAHGVPGLVNAVHKINSLDRHLCRRKAETCFSDKIIFHRYEDLYRQMLVRQAPRRRLRKAGVP